ncbi:hypothetical protein CLF_101115, partial [Clonorchis sinensis]
MGLTCKDFDTFCKSKADLVAQHRFLVHEIVSLNRVTQLACAEYCHLFLTKTGLSQKRRHLRPTQRNAGLDKFTHTVHRWCNANVLAGMDHRCGNQEIRALAGMPIHFRSTLLSWKFKSSNLALVFISDCPSIATPAHVTVSVILSLSHTSNKSAYRPMNAVVCSPTSMIDCGLIKDSELQSTRRRDGLCGRKTCETRRSMHAMEAPGDSDSPETGVHDNFCGWKAETKLMCSYYTGPLFGEHRPRCTMAYVNRPVLVIWCVRLRKLIDQLCRFITFYTDFGRYRPKALKTTLVRSCLQVERSDVECSYSPALTTSQNWEKTKISYSPIPTKNGKFVAFSSFRHRSTENKMGTIHNALLMRLLKIRRQPTTCFGLPGARQIFYVDDGRCPNRIRRSTLVEPLDAHALTNSRRRISLKRPLSDVEQMEIFSRSGTISEILYNAKAVKIRQLKDIYIGPNGIFMEHNDIFNDRGLYESPVML